MLRLGLLCCPGRLRVRAETFRSTRFFACDLYDRPGQRQVRHRHRRAAPHGGDCCQRVGDVGDVQVRQPDIADHRQHRLQHVRVLRHRLGVPGRQSAAEPVLAASAHRVTACAGLDDPAVDLFPEAPPASESSQRRARHSDVTRAPATELTAGGRSGPRCRAAPCGGRPAASPRSYRRGTPSPTVRSRLAQATCSSGAGSRFRTSHCLPR